ncbi:hypothetical protein [Macrococcus equipercicus]|uniref:Uncharacterized protein n=1 Tax=Macrococcus equipercicus TaxID=69967 RepID=A0A9Q9F127_9STAP|nr:hypothetical protein [Macrococcus equipercicus]KAA1040112.1 hypothetical protein ERX35_003745 [Macrococcus equipercicus]UTH12941.1 hypothetical protein KFV11_06560 [Macrococcus equipercicus]
MAKRQPASNSAFSYIEMLLVMLMMLIMIHMMSYHPFDYKQADVAEVNNELLAVVTYYQTLALSTGQSVTLEFLPGQTAINISSSKLGIKTSYRLRNGYIYTGNSRNASAITFSGDSINHGATVTYFVNNKRFELIFQLVRGRVRIVQG